MPYLNQNRKSAGQLGKTASVKPQAKQTIKMPAAVKIPAPGQAKG